MKNILRSKFLWLGAMLCAIGIVGCNIFNPTESVNIKNDDADALTYEGYLKFRDNEYTEAEEYFNRAIAADSSHSEAWLGLMKSILNRKLNADSETNVFSLLKYVNSNRDAKVPFSNMEDELANKLQEAVDSVDAIAVIFIERDKAGLTDSNVTYKTIADGYMVLQMMKTMLILRKTTSKMDGCLDMNSASSCDMKTVLNELKDDPGESVEAFHAVFETCEENPESMTSLFDTYLQGFEYMTEEAQVKSVKNMCGALAQETKTDDNIVEQQSKTLDIIISQFGFSDTFDDDGDGCLDEELYDGEDNDGDGEIDEDIRDKSSTIKYDQDRASKNAMAGKQTIRDLLIVKEAAPNEKYENIDIDLNGTPGRDDPDEWTFIFEKYDDRVAAADHRLKFSGKLLYNPMQYPYEDFLRTKKLIAKDNDYTNLQFDLNFRKTVIGGCWVNYTEELFKAMLDKKMGSAQ